MFDKINSNLDSISSDIIMLSIRADMATKRADELSRALKGLITLNERRDLCNLPKIEDIEPIELKELEVSKGLVPLTCKMCGGTLDHGLTCTFCGTRYKWR